MGNDKEKATRLSNRPVGRRDLLKIGATSAVIPAMLGPATITDRRASVGKSDATQRELSAGPFSLGYWSGKADEPIVSARGMRAGDALLAQHGARIEMIGMATGNDTGLTGQLESLSLDIQMGTVSYRAWGYENTVVRNISSPNAFSVPVDSKAGLVFSLAAKSAGLNGTPRAGHFRLSPGKEASTAKLQSGYYVITIGERGRALRVNWASYELVGDSTGQSIALYRNGKPVTSFPYLLFSVAPNTRDNSRFV